MITTESVVSAIIYKECGWAVAEQFEATFNDEAFEEQNGNALTYIRKTVMRILNSDVLSEDAQDELQTYCDSLEEYMAEWN